MSLFVDLAYKRIDLLFVLDWKLLILLFILFFSLSQLDSKENYTDIDLHLRSTAYLNIEANQQTPSSPLQQHIFLQIKKKTPTHTTKNVFRSRSYEARLLLRPRFRGLHLRAGSHLLLRQAESDAVQLRAQRFGKSASRR